MLHFIGHGGYDEEAQDGALALEDAAGKTRLVTGRDLSMMIRHRSLRLVVLNACEGSGPRRMIRSAGWPRHWPARASAVIAMQFEISDPAALAFSQSFYQAIADGLPVDVATVEARRTMFAGDNEIEWATPVLYLRSTDGRVFIRRRSPSTTQVDPDEADRLAREEADRLAQEEAAQREADRRAQEEATQREADRRAQEQAAQRAKEEAAQREADRLAQEEAAQREADRRARRREPCSLARRRPGRWAVSIWDRGTGRGRAHAAGPGRGPGCRPGLRPAHPGPASADLGCESPCAVLRLHQALGAGRAVQRHLVASWPPLSTSATGSRYGRRRCSLLCLVLVYAVYKLNVGHIRHIAAHVPPLAILAAVGAIVSAVLCQRVLARSPRKSGSVHPLLPAFLICMVVGLGAAAIGYAAWIIPLCRSCSGSAQARPHWRSIPLRCPRG